MSNTLLLKNVTVCAADCLHPALAARALERCMAACDFGDAILFSDKPVSGAFRWVGIAPMKSLDDYSRFCLRSMGHHIRTPFVLVVQWDGYVIDRSAWRAANLKFDYIGAPWHRDGVVGNGGFSLRSRRLLDALQAIPVLPGYPEDVIIGRLFRQVLEREKAIRFATRQVATRFSYEYARPEHPTFGFHGIRHLLNHETEEDILWIASQLSPAETSSWLYFLLVFDCLEAGRKRLAVGLYDLPRRRMGPERIATAITKGSMPAEMAVRGVEALETLWSAAGGG
jgi:hypothetical protein